jgi:hypothetical protein
VIFTVDIVDTSMKFTQQSREGAVCWTINKFLKVVEVQILGKVKFEGVFSSSVDNEFLHATMTITRL